MVHGWIYLGELVLGSFAARKFCILLPDLYLYVHIYIHIMTYPKAQKHAIPGPKLPDIHCPRSPAAGTGASRMTVVQSRIPVVQRKRIVGPELPAETAGPPQAVPAETAGPPHGPYNRPSRSTAIAVAIATTATVLTVMPIRARPWKGMTCRAMTCRSQFVAPRHPNPRQSRGSQPNSEPATLTRSPGTQSEMRGPLKQLGGPAALELNPRCVASSAC